MGQRLGDAVEFTRADQLKAVIRHDGLRERQRGVIRAQ
jgi:hypothetical protein